MTAVSDPAVLRTARALRAVSGLVEAGLWAALAGTALLFGGVHPPVYVPFWVLCAVMGGLLLLRARLLGRLRGRVGAQRVAFHPGGWLVVGEDSAYGGATGWSLDLAGPPRRGPLWLPGLLFGAWSLLQLVPLPPGLPPRPPALPIAPGWAPISVEPAATARGLCFVLALVALHAAAAAVLDRRAARERFRAGVSGLGVVLAAIGLSQKAAGTSLVYGVFLPLESQGGNVLFFGPFINRNHFAAWMLLATPIACGRLLRAWRRLQRRTGAGVNVRRRLLASQSPEGAAVALAVVPALACAASLVATGSRGGLLALVGAALLAPWLRRGTGSRARSLLRGLVAAALPVGLAALAIAWFGLDRVGVRFERTLHDSVSRTAVWSDTVERLDGLIWLGTGLDTFQTAMGSSTRWTLPEGATPWTDQEAALEPGQGYYIPEGGGGRFREAHDDYLQLLVESGAPGLVLALVGLGAALAAQRRDTWTLAALLGVMLHSLVDFPAQIPAVAALFVAVAALPERAADD